MKIDRTKIWYQKDGISQYKEIFGYVPSVNIFGSNYQIVDKSVPENFWQCLFENLNGYTLSKDDGPCIIHINGINYYSLDGKCIFTKSFAEKTNHLICKLCNDFCKQSCFFY